MTTPARPCLEDVIDAYARMRGEILAALETELGPAPWAPSATGGSLVRSGCGAGEDPGGERAQLGRWSYPGTYPDAQWPLAVDVVTAAAAAHGFDRVEATANRPRDVEIVAHDAWGGQIVFGMAANTILSLSTGCHPLRATRS
ncbi:conserved hypothetical protein [Beutenbergia cavernae DSM 12333]|uniref:Uncharacterized protein n=1 Tax=Beutenbergia cavernae (strain ATCC BAA-8 / DSM 12333 / CCUG 43141 / JCM 11478 / NBRC 16432 / NCIMB 13614 / HKI 0122) TaxID=471853 RepID=C5C1B6_BEUC1|nr:LppA family lipoprotein [Beutenbergia cavernae]ACQ81526.1 conserved hypothetical protein [Beutenbergia cavernae DSM 12333]